MAIKFNILNNTVFFDILLSFCLKYLFFNIYNPLSADELSWLTHKEEPRKNARKWLEDFQRSTNEITVKSMEDFYTKKFKS